MPHFRREGRRWARDTCQSVTRILVHSVEEPYGGRMEMRVGELARRTGVGVSTLRAWESRFKFLQPQRSPSGQRLYVETDVERVDAVLRLVAEGLTLPAAIGRVS